MYLFPNLAYNIFLMMPTGAILVNLDPQNYQKHSFTIVFNHQRPQLYKYTFEQI